MPLPSTHCTRPRAALHRLGVLATALLPLLPASTFAQASSRTRPDTDPAAMAIGCDLHTARLPDAVQTVYFYLIDARRAVLETDGNALGNVLQYNAQRIVVTKNQAEGGARTYTFDRMIGSLTVTIPAAPGSREPWIFSGECQKVDASRQKF